MIKRLLQGPTNDHLVEDEGLVDPWVVCYGWFDPGMRNTFYDPQRTDAEVESFSYANFRDVYD